ncbi:unnamed protein product, partial [Coregonus sp. 'balchen']
MAAEAPRQTLSSVNKHQATLRAVRVSCSNVSSWADRGADSNLPGRQPTCSINMAHSTEGTKNRRGSGATGGTIMKNGMVSIDPVSTAQPSPDLYNHHEHNKPPLIQHSLPSYKASALYYGSPERGHEDQDCHSLASQDSGIPTLEINHPEHIHAHPHPGESGLTLGSNHHDQRPATLSLDQSGDSAGLRKSSTFPRSSYDLVRLFSPAPRSSAGGVGVMAMSGVGGRGLNRSDDISVCSVSSLSTELSATLSVSTEDILDFMVTSDSSAIVTMETDDGGSAHFSDVTLSPGGDIEGGLRSPQRRHMGPGAEDEGRPKRLGPLASFFN